MGTVQGVSLGEEPGSREVCIQAGFEAGSLNIARRSCQLASRPVQVCRPMGHLALPGLLGLSRRGAYSSPQPLPKALQCYFLELEAWNSVHCLACSPWGPKECLPSVKGA